MTEESQVTVTPEVVTEEPTVEVVTKPKVAPLVLGAKEYAWGMGRRKTSVARVRLRAGSGVMLVNGKPLDDYFPVLSQRVHIMGPLEAAGAEQRYDIFANIRGGGPTGQSGALRLGIARALVKVEPEQDEVLRGGGFLTRDARMVERKKYGQRKARRKFQFSKR
jgi:small subunit ribosomal protein S9